MMPDLDEYVDSLKKSPKFGPQVVCHKKIGSVPPKFFTAPSSLHPHLSRLLKQQGVQHLYSHQGEAIEHILAGRDVLVATPTASGKSLIYNLPVLSDYLCNGHSTSLYLFPLKALAQDQRNVLEGLYQRLKIETKEASACISELFDGDTTSYKRRKIRDTPPRVLLTNPEMLHLSLLAYHESWIEFFSKLKFVVIDEVHSYRGVLGSHMAWVLRRLQRIARLYGADPVFILLSATIGNPGQLGEQLLGKKVEVITESGAPQAEKNMLFLNPWDSAAHAASQLLEASIKRGLRTIVYTQSRKLTELISLWTSPRLGELSAKLSSYRAGFLPEERREIEELLFKGDLLGVISTSALELGIDVGDLDLCILVGYPGSIMATWQRGGRVGRAFRKSAIILIAQEDALDQHFMRNPEDFFSRSSESALLNPENDTIAAQHLHCAAAELPLTRSELLFENKQIVQVLDHLVHRGLLLETASGGTWIASRRYPQRLVTLRGGGTQMDIIDGNSGEIIGEIDNVRALKECHPEAIYLHRQRSWVIQKLDLGGNEVVALEQSPKYFTRPMVEKNTEILEIISSKSSFGVQVSFGRLRVREQVTGYQKRNNRTQKLLSTTPLHLPEQAIETEGVWLEIAPETVAEMERDKYHFMGAIHALEHAMIALFPLLVLCDRNDIGGISCPLHEQTEEATVFIYDGYPGGVGLAREAYNKIDILIQQTQTTVEACTCDNGCPSCVHSPKCGSGNRPIDKKACLILLSRILAVTSTKNQKEMPIHVNSFTCEATSAPGSNTVQKSEAKRKGLDALPERFGVFDLETIRSAEEVGGWQKAEFMGVSVGVVYDSREDSYFTYLEHEMEQLVDHLAQLDLVVGFNNKRFDNRVLSAYTTMNLSALPTLDLLEEIHNHLGYRLSLNRLAEHTLGVQKSGDGLQALQWYKEGRLDLIQHYCKKDVEITKNLLLTGLEQGFFLFANKAKQIVRIPLRLDSAIGKIRDHC
ncbi:DEAD/DEAH box helicase [Desulforhopalus sp. IMCC35007]|uniref:DEAD/DEAH box helicase n=1 Tax=Desulforhopalus sp. IMCC35007 TaxID=2569543 RepID=UPI00197A8263|nr:DEAD/DEAH box helicase [Desulforhopalus sp. IMCC35007]